MHVHRSASGLVAAAPAKLNLFLEVLAKRDDGFHEIETLMAPIAWYDTLVFAPGPRGTLTLSCHASRDVGALELPHGEDNLVLRGLRRLAERSGTAQGGHITLYKRIPLAAGLAGGSSDAAAALSLANEGWQLHWSRAQLAEIAAELGSDVPFFLGRGAAVCRGRGEKIEPLANLGTWHFVIVRPPVGLSTAQVYRACAPAAQPRCAAPLAEALRHGCPARAGQLLHNQLQAAAATLTPWIDRLRREFARLDCLGHQMSGSGTSYFGLCRNARHALRIGAILKSRGLGVVRAVSSCG